ncbi:MAG TPA: TetR/AcrR family transcriptional regulator [Candidatus Binataceae bacterium]|nr:TetR/AcrR family transcriptional regulator [Candidatus Binataceae bacterium]
MPLTPAESTTKEKLLEAAKRLMLKKGCTATTIDDICKAAGFTKGGFFHHFESKEQLAEEVLDRFFTLQQESIAKGGYRKHKDPLRRVYGYVNRLIELSKGPEMLSGCLLGSFTHEMAGTNPAMRGLCARRFAQWVEGFKQDLDDAKAQHAPRTAFDTGSLSEHLIAVLQGSVILAKAQQDAKIVERNLQHFKRYMKELFDS